MISIVIPVYNSALYLDNCLRSVWGQSYTDWECIVVDDGSTDESPIICDRWGNKDNRFKIIHTFNGGVSKARNKGINMAQGDYLCFIDSDDWVDEDYLSTFVEHLSDNDLVVTGSTQVSFYKKEMIEERFLPSDNCFITFIPACTDAFIANLSFFFGPCSKLYNGTIIRKFGIRFPEDISLGEDLEFNFLYLQYVDQICLLKSAHYYYRKDVVGSLVKKYRTDVFDLHYRQWKIQKNFLISKNMWNSISMSCLYRALWGYVYEGLFHLHNLRYHRVRQILSIDEVAELQKEMDNFECASWIKWLVVCRHSLMMWLVLKCNDLRFLK